MAYQKRNKGPRYQSTGQITVAGKPGLKTSADQYKAYLKKLMGKLQSAARQSIFRTRPFLGRCMMCGDADTSWFYVSYESPPQVMPLCASHHKEMSQHRGSVYDQLKRHGVDVLSWEEWKDGMRPINK